MGEFWCFIYIKLNNITIKTETANLVDYIEKSDTFDAIVCMNILQFIPANKIQHVIKYLHDKTSVGGYNTIVSFIAPNIERKQKAISSYKIKEKQKHETEKKK